VTESNARTPVVLVAIVGYSLILRCVGTLAEVHVSEPRRTPYTRPTPSFWRLEERFWAANHWLLHHYHYYHHYHHSRLRWTERARYWRKAFLANNFRLSFSFHMCREPDILLFGFITMTFFGSFLLTKKENGSGTSTFPSLKKRYGRLRSSGKT